jgi:hypothetical protein
MLSPCPAGAEEISEQSNADLRLALTKVSLYAETDKMDQAFALVDQLKKQYPNNPQVLQAEADLNLRIGNRGAGFAALNRAMSIDPGNEDLIDRQRTAMVAQGPFASAGYNFRRTTLAYEHFARFAGQATVSPSMSIGVSAENDHLHSREPITRVNGMAQHVDVDRQRATITLGKVYDNGNEAAALLYGNSDTLGAGLRYSMWDRHGATTVEGNVRRPNWEYVETVIADGTKDNIRLERKQIISSRLQATVGGGFNQHNLDDDSDAAQSLAWDLNLAYNYPYSLSDRPGDEVMLGVYYTVDAEYFSHVDERTFAGRTYKPLPASSYEIHSINLSASKDITSRLHTEAYGGYGVDRLGSNGPLFGGSLVYAPVEKLGIELRGTRTMLGGEHNTEREDQLGVNLKWRW